MTEQTIFIMRTEWSDNPTGIFPIFISIFYLKHCGIPIQFWLSVSFYWNFQNRKQIAWSTFSSILFYKLIWIFRDDLENCSSTSKGGQICMWYNSNKKDFLKEHKSISYNFPIWSHVLLVFTRVRHIFIVGLWIYLF